MDKPDPRVRYRMHEVGVGEEIHKGAERKRGGVGGGTAAVIAQ